MPAFAAPIEVIQAALHRIGEDEIASLDADDSAARVARSNYEGIVRAVFARHAWTFARAILPLTYQGKVELGPWLHAFVWPSEVMNISEVMVSGADAERLGAPAGRRLRSGEYALEEGRLLTVFSTALQVKATIRPDESMWPGDVAEAIVVRLQGLFLEALCDKPQDARLKIRDAEALLRDAIVRDKRQEPGVSFEVVPLAEAWRGRAGRRRAY